MEADCGEQVESKSQDIVWGQLVSLLLTNMRNTENMPIPVPEFIVHQLFLVAFQMPFSPSAHRFLCCFICVGFFLCVCVCVLKKKDKEQTGCAGCVASHGTSGFAGELRIEAKRRCC